MKILRQLILLLMIALIVPLHSCDKSDEPALPPTPEGTEHTLICYLAGFSLSYYFYQNIDMMKAALRTLSLEDKNLQDKVRVVYIFQGASRDKAYMYEMEFKNGVCESSAEPIAVYNLPERTEAEAITYFIGEAIRHAPARSYGLILGGHSRGWTPIDINNSISHYYPRLQSPKTMADHKLWTSDENMMTTRFFGDSPDSSDNYFSCIEIADLAKGLEDTGVKFEYTIYDACFMANVESLYELRNTTKYGVGSVCEIMGAGFPYKHIIPCLLGTGGISFDLDGVCREFNNYYSTEYGYSGSVSLTDMGQLEALAEAFAEVRRTGIKEDVKNSVFQCYDGLSKELFIDLGDYVHLAAENDAAREAFMTQLDKTVIARHTLSKYYSAWGDRRGFHAISPSSYYGLSTSYSSEFYRDEYYQTAWYKASNE